MGIVNIMNSFTTKNDINETISPGMIVEKRTPVKIHDKMITFGAYALVHMGTTNAMNGRNIPAIALRASNHGGRYYFMNLETGQKIHAHVWTELPLPEGTVKHVENMAKNEQQPEIENNNLIFE